VAASGIDLEAETDRLYQLSLAEFVAARNGLVATLKSKGDKDNATRVRALARPNAPAWAANQAYWTARREFDALVASTRSVWSAQAEGASGAALREAMKKRREAHAAVMERAESLLVAAGHGASPDTLRRVSNTLDALAAESARPGGVLIHPGRLIRDLEPPGFTAVTESTHDASRSARLEPGPSDKTLTEAKRPSGTGLPPPAQRGKEPRTQALKRARAALAKGERHLERARREAQAAADALSVAEKRARGARDALDEITRRLQKATEGVGRATAAATAAREHAEQTAAVRKSAEAARDVALRSVLDLE